MALLRQLEEQARATEQETRLKDPLEAAKAQATARQFELRRNVDAPVSEMTIPAPRGGGRMPPLAADYTPPTRGIRRISTNAAQPAISPSVRSITTGSDFTDPDAAMGTAERATLHPSVLAEEERTRGEAAAAARLATKPIPPASPYSQERAQRVKNSVDELTKKVSRWTAGYGSKLAVIPETEARNFAAELDTLKGNIAFNELAAMREASKTGGALGAVSEREMALLSSALGALDPGQSPENLKQQLAKVGETIDRWNRAQRDAAVPSGRRVGRFIVEE